MKNMHKQNWEKPNVYDPSKYKASKLDANAPRGSRFAGLLALGAFGAIAALSSGSMTSCKTNTILEPVPYAVHDTTVKRDTTTRFDTLIVRDTIHLHDTLVSKPDTVIVTKRDTVVRNDTIVKNTRDTLVKHDTLVVTKHDTTLVPNYIHDTTIIYQKIVAPGGAQKNHLVAGRVVYKGKTSDVVVGPDPLAIGGGISVHTINGGRDYRGNRLAELEFLGTNGSVQRTTGIMGNGQFADLINTAGTDTVRFISNVVSRGLTQSQVPIAHLEFRAGISDSLVDLMDMRAGQKTVALQFVSGGVITRRVLNLDVKNMVPTGDSLSRLVLNGGIVKQDSTLKVGDVKIHVKAISVQDSANPILIMGSVTDSLGTKPFTLGILPGEEVSVPVSLDSARTPGKVSFRAPAMDIRRSTFQIWCEVRDSVGNSVGTVLTPSDTLRNVMGVKSVSVNNMIDPSEDRARKSQNGSQ